MKKVVLFLTLAVVGLWLITPAWAENASTEDIEALKKQLSDLQSVVQNQQQQIQQQEMKIQEQDRKLLDMQGKNPEQYLDMEQIVAKVQEKLPPMTDGFTLGKGKIHVTPYGFIRLDMAYDDSAVFMFSGNVVGWAWPEEGVAMPNFPTEVHRDDDDNFSMTATATRLGLNLDGPEFAGGNIKGKIEIDFDELNGNGGDVVAHRIRMRHAYAELLYPTWSLLAGQTWDIVAPRIPPMLDCVVMWGSGNVGYRRPQLRLTKWWDIDGTKLTGQASINHVDRSLSDDFDADLLLNGVESGYPMGEVRVGVDTVILGGRKIGLGLSGLVARNQTEAKGDISQKEELDEWMIAFDGGVTIIPQLLTLQGEIWTGKNLGNVYGGVVQSFVDTDPSPTGIDLKEIEASGGFISANITPRSDLQFNVGYGIDDPDNEDMILGNIAENWTVYGNAIWNVVPDFDIGLELAYHKTKWIDNEDGDDFRVQSAFIYKF